MRPLMLATAIFLLGSQPIRAFAQIKYRIFDVSLPEFKLRTWEQVTALDCKVTGGAIVRVSVPLQWNIALDSSIGSQSVLTAFAIHGADAFYQQELAPFHKAFLSIAEDSPALVLSFDVTLVLTIENNEHDTQRKLTFNRKDLILTPGRSGQYPFW
jgi:hypothetical protein